MFVFQLSYVSTLQAVADRCRIPLVSFVNELDHAGIPLYGIEIELPSLFHFDMPRRLFFWSSVDLEPSHAYEDAAFQAINSLQGLYGFTIVDYSYRVMIQQRDFMRRLFSVANHGAQLARMVVASAEHETAAPTHAVSAAERLIEELDLMMNPDFIPPHL
jgi:hypothetical protein